jgi:peptidylprolyl isomerase
LIFRGIWPTMMGMWRHVSIVLILVLALVGCRLKEEEPPTVPAPDDVAGPPADALHTPSGLASKVLSIGFSNVRPGPRSSVRVHYTGWTTDGEMFDSSVVRGQPVEFQVSGVIPGWTEGLQLMVVGEKRRFWIPGSLAYDDAPPRPAGMPGPPQGMLVFDVELLEVR